MKQGLYDSSTEFDSCGVGFVCHIKGGTSHSLIDNALQMLENMSHRGASGCEPDSGDGAGIMMRLPDQFLRREALKLGINLPPQGQYAVAQVFLPQDPQSLKLCVSSFEEVIKKYDMEVLGWRDVPVNHDVVGPTPRRTEPVIKQLFVAPGHRFFNRYDFDRRLYLVRQHAENLIEFGDYPVDARESFYICIMSANRLVYKGMLTAQQLKRYYLDLTDPELESSFAIVHSRFSTNTNPAWHLAHPFRYLAHNGEINTLRGNRNWMRSRYANLQSEIFGAELQAMFPILTESGSDSATLDNAIQFLAVNGRSLAHSVLMIIPEAWQNNTTMDPELRAFYEYHAALMEPWDGPASIAFTNGYLIGAVLDRNGLRPSRYYLTDDDLVIMSSEVGALPIAPSRVLKKWRLEPGKMFLVDTKQGRIVHDQEIKSELCDKRPWKRWIDNQLLKLEELTSSPDLLPPSENLTNLQLAFGYTQEDLKLIIQPMAQNAEEPIGSMGNDLPLACLSDTPVLLYDYFKQLFAQVTNPPLDAIREQIVTSLYTYLGCQGNLLEEKREYCRMLRLKTPILSNQELAQIKAITDPAFRHITLPMLFNPELDTDGLERTLTNLGHNAIAAVKSGVSLLILSDRGVCATHAAIPSLLALAAVNRALINEGIRASCSILLESGEAREAHHFCLLIGYGASAVNPYLALDSIANSSADCSFKSNKTVSELAANYLHAANKSLLKAASKMGISTIQSYRGAQIFEALGLGAELIEKYFPHTPSRLGGIGLETVRTETIARHCRGFANSPSINAPTALPQLGHYKWRRDGEYHMWNPDTVVALQRAVRSGDYQAFKKYSALADAHSDRLCTIRGLLALKPAAPPISLSEVEPAAAIAKRFATGAMSFGSISRVAHETIALAMNSLGAKSNSGEGGEDPERYLEQPVAHSKRSAIKQIASGRFGVTAEYLVHATELQIKMAQGAKPGEGGQLPGHKVDAYVGMIRHAQPGVQLISPPPHHDIYSIEDLAQLIFDLKNINPQARISVKLASEIGVGTIAAGVAKCKADHILISGDSGGTGAAPLSSIQHSGLPWELGLAEAHQALIIHGLRGRVTLQTDGQIKTGRDIIIAALLGAEEIGFGTIALIALGCVMARVCHLNTCPTGIATQDPKLHERFKGKPEHIINLMMFLAEEVREYLAQLGFRTLRDAVGHVASLSSKDLSAHPKAQYLDLSPIIYQPTSSTGTAAITCEKQDHNLNTVFDHILIKHAEPALVDGRRVEAAFAINNTDRTLGAMLAGHVVRRGLARALPDDTINFLFRGSAGQSFGAFLVSGITFRLEGDANDYLGKGLCGGKIIAYPPEVEGFVAEDNIICGNVIGYGATSGEIYLRGQVGERFCVRNSGARAVVEGIGDHGCEYMTGGCVVILGPTGRNFAAGMTGGVAYIYDNQNQFAVRCNTAMVNITKLSAADWEEASQLIMRHWQLTKSALAERILSQPNAQQLFVKVTPITSYTIHKK